LIDTPDIATKKIMSATTDSVGSINWDWGNQPGITSLLQILALMSNKSQSEINEQWIGNKNYGQFKKAVAEVISDFLIDFQSKLADISDEDLLNKLEKSESILEPIAKATLLKAQRAVGLRPKV
jgi:tryptophanyl-tRNA synthetase